MFPRVTHPSATPYCYGVRLACVRPAASVRSEPGSNSQVESSDSGRLGRNLSKDLCVTGTFTLEIDPIRVAPNSDPLLVMAETQYRQSLFAIHHTLARW